MSSTFSTNFASFESLKVHAAETGTSQHPLHPVMADAEQALQALAGFPFSR
jgi:hypothetical protein